MSSRRVSERQLRKVRKDMLRARAQVERYGLVRSARRAAAELTPGALARSLVPVRLTGKRPSDWLMEGVRLVRRYPFLVSTVSAVFSGLRRRRRLWRIAASVLAGWGLTRLGRRRRAEEDGYV